MGRIKFALWGLLALLLGLWVAADPLALAATGFFGLRPGMVQGTGILAIGCMTAAMILALRPRWPERWFGGLDKMYRLHKWFGIGGLVLVVLFAVITKQNPLALIGAISQGGSPAAGTPESASPASDGGEQSSDNFEEQPARTAGNASGESGAETGASDSASAFITVASMPM